MSGKDVVFITIYREDRDWINKTKHKCNREQRLHAVIRKYREEFCEDAKVPVVKA